jgi:hypothetical protein
MRSAVLSPIEGSHRSTTAKSAKNAKALRLATKIRRARKAERITLLPQSRELRCPSNPLPHTTTLEWLACDLRLFPEEDAGHP